MSYTKESNHDLWLDTLAKHIQVNAEYALKLSIILETNFPSLAQEISELVNDWKRINSEINSEYTDDVSKNS